MRRQWLPPTPVAARSGTDDAALQRLGQLLGFFTALVMLSAAAQLLVSPRPLVLRLLGGLLLLSTVAVPFVRRRSSRAGWLIIAAEGLVIAVVVAALPRPEAGIPLVFAVSAQQAVASRSGIQAGVAIGVTFLSYLTSAVATALTSARAFEPAVLLGFLPGLVFIGFTTRLLVAALEARGRAERTASSTGARLRTVISTSPVGLVHLDAAGRVQLVNPAAERILQVPASSLLGTMPARLPRLPADLAAFVERLRLGHGLTDHELVLPARNADPGAPPARHLSVSAAPTTAADGSADGMLISVTDISERAALEAQLRQRAHYDELTGLANRALFRDRTTAALAGASATARVAVLLLDLDEFKTVNDSLGHVVGDRLLVAVAERLRGCVRGEDTLSRLGGDEFAVLLEGTTEQAAVAAAERIVAALAAPVVVEGRELPVRSSVGVAVTTGSWGVSFADLLRDADTAMYTAKRQGGGVRVFHAAMRLASLERMQLEADLRGGLAHDELVVHYQCAVDLGTGRVTGIEALVRWWHPRRGLLSPDAFIGLAEETGLIVPLGRQVLEQSCAQTMTWLRRHPSCNLRLAVNVSPRQLRDAGLVDDVRRALTGSGLPPHLLTLEITESQLADETAIDTLWALKGLGVVLALDDFGTGYSALAYLQKFPIDILKIDKAFVARLAEGGQAAALARSVIDLAHALDMTTVGEGVETDEQAALLENLGCRLAQGFYFARPAPPETLDEVFELAAVVAQPARPPAEEALAGSSQVVPLPLTRSA